MRGSYSLNTDEKKYWIGIFKEYFKFIHTIDEIDLSKFDLAPCHVKEILLELGFKEDSWDSNGWEQDTWYYFSDPTNKYPAIAMFYCGYTFELKISERE